MSLLRELLEAIEKLGMNWKGEKILSDKFYLIMWGNIEGTFDSESEAEADYLRTRSSYDDDREFSPPRLEIITSKEDAEDWATQPKEEIEHLFQGEDPLIIKGSIFKAWMHRFPKIVDVNFYSHSRVTPWKGTLDTRYYRTEIVEKIEKILNSFNFGDLVDYDVDDKDLVNKIEASKFINFKLVHGVEKAVINRVSPLAARAAFRTIRMKLLENVDLGVRQVGEPHSFGVSRWVGEVRTKENSDAWYNSNQTIPLYIVLEYFDTQVHLTIYPQRLLPNAIQRLLTKR